MGFVCRPDVEICAQREETSEEKRIWSDVFVQGIACVI